MAFDWMWGDTAIRDAFLGTTSPGEHGIDVAYLDDYSDYQGIRNQIKDYWGGIMAGQEPDWMKRYLPGVLQDEFNQLDRAYLGDPGQRGNSVLGQAYQAGAITGVGPKATMANASKVNYELAAKKAAAQAAMDKYRASWFGTSANQGAQQLAGLPQGQRYTSTGYNIQPQTNPGLLQPLMQGAGTGIGMWAGSQF